MIKIKKIEVVPLREKFGIQHKLYLENNKNLKKLKDLFEKFASAEEFEVKDNLIKLVFSSNTDSFTFILDRNIGDFYNENVHREWKDMVASAMGMEEPFRYYSFYTEDGKHIGTIGYKQDCDSLIPIIVIYKSF